MVNEHIEEEKHLEYVKEYIRNSLVNINQNLESKFKNIIDSKKYVWENIYEMDPVEIASNSQVIDFEISTYETNLKRKRILEKLLYSPYFGRIDFVEDNDSYIESFYIGINNLFKENSVECLIYDWRAPVASMFYDYEIGKAKFTAPVGDINGSILKKMQYKIVEGKLEYLFESSLKIDDEILQKELVLIKDTKMQNIVSTIQKEQNSIIRSDNNHTLIVQEVAGSGKLL